MGESGQEFHRGLAGKEEEEEEGREKPGSEKERKKGEK